MYMAQESHPAFEERQDHRSVGAALHISIVCQAMKEQYKSIGLYI